MHLDLVETVSKLVAIPSVNPLGRDVSGPELLETRLTDHLEAVFEAIGVRHQRQPVAPGRDNIVARLDGSVPPEDGGRVILFDAHQDTAAGRGNDDRAVPPGRPPGPALRPRLLRHEGLDGGHARRAGQARRRAAPGDAHRDDVLPGR